MSDKKHMDLIDSVTGGIDDCNAGRVYTGPERRAGWHEPGTCINMRIVEDKFADGAERMGRIEKRIDSLEKSLEANTEATTEIRDILQLGKSFFRLADIIGRVIKWVAAIAVPVIGVWMSIKGGGDRLS